MKMRRTVRWLGALVLLICTIAIGSVDLCSTVIGSVRSPIERAPSVGLGNLVATSRACQTFVAQYDGLSQIRILLYDYGRKNSGPFYFYLRKAPDAAENIVSLTDDASEVDNNVHHTFEFPPIKDSAGRSYAFCLEAPEAPLDSSITAKGFWDDWYPEGEAVLRDMWGGDVGVQDLDFHLGYRLSLWDKLRILSERLVANKPFLCGARWFYVVLGVTYLVLLYGLFVKVMPAGNPDTQE